MIVQHNVTIDVVRQRKTVVRVVQEDSARQIRLTLLRDSVPYDVSEGISDPILTFVEFKKADGHGGMYDTTSTGETAVELEDSSVPNVWIVSLDGQCFTAPGWTQINVRFETESGKRIHTFAIMVDVEPTASSDTESTDWGELNSIADLRNAVAELATIVEHMAETTGLTETMKQAFLACFAHVGWEETDGQEYYDALESALYPPAELLSISAVFEQGETVIYDTDSLDDLKPMLTVTARYADGTSAEVTTYTLSGTLAVGTSTITVNYGGKTATFDVTVSNYSRLPAEYQEVEWVGVRNSTATPTAYIDAGAGVIPGRNTLHMELKPFSIIGQYDSPAGYEANGFEVYYSSNGSNLVQYMGSNTLESFTYSIGQDWDSFDLSMSRSTGLRILTYKTNQYAFNGKVKYATVTDTSDNLVHEYIPCYRKSDNEVGMYDTITGTFLTNSGTGTLVKGDDV